MDVWGGVTQDEGGSLGSCRNGASGICVALVRTGSWALRLRSPTVCRLRAGGPGHWGLVLVQTQRPEAQGTNARGQDKPGVLPGRANSRPSGEGGHAHWGGRWSVLSD